MEGDKKAAAMAEGVVEQKTKEAAAAGDVSLKELSKKLNDFAKERDWEQYHSPRNLLLAMVCIFSSPLSKSDHVLPFVFSCFANMYLFKTEEIAEVGELSELFMWKGEVRKGLADWDEAEKEHLGEELSDVLLYLIRLSDMCGVDLADAATRKIVKNAVKYPAPSKEGA